MSTSKIEETRRRITDAVHLACLAEIVSQEIEMGNIPDGTETIRCAGAIWGAARMAGEKLSEASELLDLAEMEERAPARAQRSRSHGRHHQTGRCRIGLTG